MTKTSGYKFAGFLLGNFYFYISKYKGRSWSKVILSWDQRRNNWPKDNQKKGHKWRTWPKPS
ncbi:hypothetical protein C7H83_02990 [Tetragenococcus halophilus]|uniref:Uncharacterized protein n=1 Tax=Tetragenococcus halophilus TaxID=51669 RepID=A0A3G5FGN9_TETHA|nr:hypothetical protein AC806_01240 [Tetragenococcus halophilus]AYW49527.1 hypothetical protein C7H83_02990 [Tetragenococcus halophilus]